MRTSGKAKGVPVEKKGSYGTMSESSQVYLSEGPVFKSPNIEIDEDLPDGVLVGFDVEGKNVVCIQFEPNFEFLYGTHADEFFVKRWHVSPDHARRIQAIAMWHVEDYECVGTA